MFNVTLEQPLKKIQKKYTQKHYRYIKMELYKRLYPTGIQIKEDRET